jgi:competence protein ComEA
MRDLPRLGAAPEVPPAPGEPDAAAEPPGGSGGPFPGAVEPPGRGWPYGPAGDLARPGPPRTWRDRLDDVTASAPSPARVALAAGGLALAGLIGWRLLAPPPPPPEMTLPFADQALAPAGAGGPAARDGDGDPAAGPRGAPGPGAGAPAPGSAPGGGPAGETVIVHVAGAVAEPGVQRLPAGARVVDALEAAGGPLPEADLARVNLAAVLVDGQQVYVVRPGEIPPTPVPGAGAGGPAGGTPAAPVDVNRAPAALLEELPGVGPTTAAAIIAHREQHGPFASVDDLLEVRGIGEAKLEQLRGLVTV